MFTVALIGPDGAGKTTIGRRLEKQLPLPVKYIYMGINADSSNLLLPTSRLIRLVKRLLGAKPDIGGPPDPDRVQTTPKGIGKRALRSLRAGVRLGSWISEEWFRQALTWYYQHCGYIVLFDRHFFSDYYAYDIVRRGNGQPVSRRIHGFLLQHVYPRPDLVIYLDAPAEVLFARKGEGTIPALERRRKEYLEIRGQVKHFEVVDANRPEDDVTRDVTLLISNFYQMTSRGSKKVSHGRQ